MHTFLIILASIQLFLILKIYNIFSMTSNYHPKQKQSKPIVSVVQIIRLGSAAFCLSDELLSASTLRVVLG